MTQARQQSTHKNLLKPHIHIMMTQMSVREKIKGMTMN